MELALNYNDNGFCSFCNNKHRYDFHASFSCRIVFNKNKKPIVLIVDCAKKNEPRRSLTNDIEYALWKLKLEHPCVAGCYVIYRDSKKNWDEVIINKQGDFVCFRSLATLTEQSRSEKDFKRAIEKCYQLHDL